MFPIAETWKEGDCLRTRPSYPAIAARAAWAFESGHSQHRLMLQPTCWLWLWAFMLRNSWMGQALPVCANTVRKPDCTLQRTVRLGMEVSLYRRRLFCAANKAEDSPWPRCGLLMDKIYSYMAAWELWCDLSAQCWFALTRVEKYVNFSINANHKSLQHGVYKR